MNRGRLYALQFSNGAVKVGVTSSHVARWRILSVGKRPVSAVCSPPIEWRHMRAEGDLLQRMRRIFIQAPIGLETFNGADFGATVTLLRQVYRRYGSSVTGWRSFYGMVPFKQRAIRQMRQGVFA